MTRLDDVDPSVQRKTIETLRYLGPPGRKAIPVATAKLKSGDKEVRLAAAEFIGSFGNASADAVPGLISMLNDSSPELRITAARTLGRLSDSARPAFVPLTSLLNAEQAEVREAATLTLGNLGLDAEELRPHLAKMLRDKNLDVRRAAISAIQRLGPQGSRFVPDLILLAGTSGKEELGPLQRILRRYERGEPDVRSIPELITHLEHDQAPVRLLAIKFLGLAGGNAKEAIPALERLREDPSADVQKQAEAACERIKAGK